MDKLIEVRPEIKDLIEIFWKAIDQRHVLEFYFESEDGNVGPRAIKPYMVCFEDEKKIKVVGLPRELWDKTTEKEKQPRHYLLEKIDINQVKLQAEAFIDPGVPRDIVINTKKVKVICRFIYPEENKEEVMKSWIKINGLILK